MTKQFTLRNNNIPQILKERGQWALWTGDKEPTKLNGYAMKWRKEPESRLTWQQVEPFYKIGWFVEPEVGIIVIDFDGCRNKATGEIHSMVKAWIDQAHSYAEISQSGTGLKLYVLGSIPYNKAVKTVDVPWKDMYPEHTGIEIYAKSRFIAITGYKLPECPSEIVEAQEPLLDMLTRFTPAPEQKQKTPGNNQHKSGKDSYAAVLRGLDVVEYLNDGVLIECPWIASHSTPYPYARLYYGPPHTFHCFHTNCANREWRDVRLHVDPRAYDYEQRYKPYRPRSRVSLLARANELLSNETISEATKSVDICWDCGSESWVITDTNEAYCESCWIQRHPELQEQEQANGALNEGNAPFVPL